MDWAICLRIVVLPAFGGETTMPRWPLPMGATRSITRGAKSFGFHSRRSRSIGYSGVRSSKLGRQRPFGGGADLAHYVVATPQVEAFDLAGRYVDVALALAVAPRPEEAEAVGQHIEDSALQVLLAALAVPVAPLLLTAVLTAVLTVAAAAHLALTLDLFCGGEVRVGLTEAVDRRGGRRLRRTVGAFCSYGGFLRCCSRCASVGRSFVLLARRLLGCDLVDHLGQLRLAVLAVLLYSQLRGDLVQVTQALALQGRSFGHVRTPPLLFTMRKCLSTDFFTGLSKLEAPPACLGL